MKSSKNKGRKAQGKRVFVGSKKGEEENGMPKRAVTLMRSVAAYNIWVKSNLQDWGLQEECNIGRSHIFELRIRSVQDLTYLTSIQFCEAVGVLIFWM